MQSFKLLKISALALLSMPSLFAHEDDFSLLKKRIDELEKRVYLSNHNAEQVNTFGSQKLNIGGYANVTGTQLLVDHATNDFTFDEVELGLMMRARVNDQLSFFTHIEFEQEKEITNIHSPYREFDDEEVQMEPEDIIITYRPSNSFSLNLGALITPFGVSNMEHFDFLRWQNEKPMALREKSDRFIFFDDHVNGVSTVLESFHDWGTFKYYLYAGTSQEAVDGVTTGARVSYANSSGTVKTGLSFQNGRKQRDDRYMTFGWDMKARLGEFEFRSEAFLADLDSGVYGQDRNPFSFYFEPWYHLVHNTHILYSRIDYLNDTMGLYTIDHDLDSSTMAISDPVELYEYTLGYNYLPYPYWRISLGVTFVNYVGSHDHIYGLNRDYETIEWGTVLSF